MTGRFIAVVGPSGVGKDSVMEALANQAPDLVLARRVITRPASAGGEVFEGVTEPEFHAREAAGAFALSWSAHGLRYAIPASVDASLQNGQDILANLSRSVLAEAQARFARFEVIRLTASPDILAARLASRGRETSDQIATRLDRQPAALPDGMQAHEIDNSGTLAETVQAVLSLLYPQKDKSCT